MITYVHPGEPNQQADIICSILDLLSISYEPYMPGFFIGDPSEENRVAYLLTRLLEGFEGGAGTSGWLLTGNDVSAVKKLGTTTNYGFEFITNNTTQGQITAAGKWIIGQGSTASGVLNVIGSYVDDHISLLIQNNDGTRSTEFHNNGTIYRNGSLYSISSHNYNVSWGPAALSAVENGSNNVAIGFYALAELENDNAVIGIGSYSGLHAEGSEHVFIGHYAGQGTINTGSVAIGSHAAGSDDSEGNFYVAIGYYSLTKNSGYGNVAVGGSSGSDNAGGSHNVYIGNESGYSQAHSERNNVLGDYNICLGDTAVTGGSDFDSVISINSKGGTASNQIVFGGAVNQYTSKSAYYTDLYLGSGVTSETLTDFTIYGTSAVGDNIAASDYELGIAPPRGTGTGAGGSIKLYHCKSSGGADDELNTLEPMLTIDDNDYITVVGIRITSLAGHGTQPLSVDNNGLVFS